MCANGVAKPFAAAYDSDALALRAAHAGQSYCRLDAEETTFGSLADKPSRAKNRVCLLLPESGHFEPAVAAVSIWQKTHNKVAANNKTNLTPNALSR